MKTFTQHHQKSLEEHSNWWLKTCRDRINSLPNYWATHCEDSLWLARLHLSNTLPLAAITFIKIFWILLDTCRDNVSPEGIWITLSPPSLQVLTQQEICKTLRRKQLYFPHCALASVPTLAGSLLLLHAPSRWMNKDWPNIDNAQASNSHCR